MTEKEYYNQVTNLMGEIINLSEVQITFVDEQEKQVLGAYCFGVLNGYSLERKINPIQIQGAMIDILVKIFNYPPSTSAQFCDFLIQCTDEKFHPSINAIIHKGIEGYYEIKDGKKESIQQVVNQIIKSVKYYSEK
ncbi:MAG: Imm48 family immunity protein [Erysipelotrichaceae bacterium]|uniref:Imm48 family immunity protein n=1 Tax=Anaerorhabdus sp. TaxID=1872524 RepID=UPI002FC8C8E5